MNTDDTKKNKIVWKRDTGANDDTQSGVTPSSSDRDFGQSTNPSPSNTGSSDAPTSLVFKRNSNAADTSVTDMATQAAAHVENSPVNPTVQTNDLQSIDDLRAEIEQAFGGKEDPSKISVTSKDESVVSLDGTVPETPKVSTQSEEPLLPVTPKANKVEETVVAAAAATAMPPKTIKKAESLLSQADAQALNSSSADGLAQENHDALVESLKNEINSEFDKNGSKTDEEFATEKDKQKGMGQTYYSDLSKAMGANEPATMSELIKKSRFEKQRDKITSAFSRKNIMYIAASVILLIASLAVVYTIFGSRKDPVEFVSEERVSSLVYANQDTGINVTGIESERIKQAIRTVVERELPEDTINQIYYVEKTPSGTARRLGIKDILDKTDNETPALLYDNIESDFMHGVYGSDRNYPFIILNTLSYDRALQGMKEWEPTMLDDLATYFDLPPEATDRSLLKPGFEDDLIRNKNVRVSRFLPREVDGRGILEFLKFNSNKPDPESTENVDTTNSGVTLSETENTANTETGIDTSNTVEVDQQGNIVNNTISWLWSQLRNGYKGFIQNSAYAQVGGSSFSSGFNANANGQRVCYSIQKSCINRATGQTVPYQQGDPTQLCTDVRTSNTPVPSTPALEGDTLNYSCVNTLSGGDEIGQGDALSQVSDQAPICFNNQTGARLQTSDSTQFCFASYRCNRTACTLNGVEVPASQEGNPGVVCGQETQDIVAANATLPDGSPMPKICREFTDILSYQNINQAPVCFDGQSNYLRYKTPNDPRLGFNCILPQNRSQRLCVTQNEKIVVRTGQEIFTTDKFCFQPNQQAATNIGVNGQCADLTVAQIQSRLSWVVLQLRLAAGVGSVFGLSSQDVNNINEAANHLADLSQGNVLQVEAARQTALVLQNLEEMLDRMDPNRQLPQNGPNGGLNLYGMMREIIDTVKCTLGIANTLQWSTLGQIPQGITIYAGQTIEGVEPVQQALVLMGLMDPLSISGTLDLVTQDAISQFQLANALDVTGILDPETLAYIQTVIENQDGLYGGDEAIINDYFVITDGDITTNGIVDADGNIITGGVVDADGNIVTGGATSADAQILTMGAYNNSVQNLQVLLYAEGYDVSNINGLFDEQTCAAVQEFQADNELEVADPVSCTLSVETLQALNDVIRANGYLGSGLSLSPQGYLQGVGKLEGTFGPGVANFEVNQAEADTLREGDIVLMYMFLDEQTILIARDQVVIDEVIQRRVLSDIFNK